MLVYYWNDSRLFWGDDSRSYLNITENLYQGHGFAYVSEPPYPPDSYRTPGYPLFLLFHRAIFQDYHFALLSQILLVAWIGYMIFLFASKLDYQKLGYIAAAVFSFTPISMIAPLEFLTETLFVSAVILSAYFWLKFLESKRNLYLMLTAILIPLTALIRPIGQYLVVLFILSFFYYCYLNKSSFDKKMLCLVPLTLVLIFFAVLFPWQFRNYLVFGHYDISSILWIQMYFYDAPSVYSYTHHITYDQASKILTREALDKLGLPNAVGPAEIPSEFDAWPYLKQRSLEIMFSSPKALFESRSELFFKFFVRDGARAWFRIFSPEQKEDISIKEVLKFKDTSLFAYSVVLERAFLFLLFLGTVAMSVFAFYMEREKRFMVHLFSGLVIYVASLTGIMASALYRFQIEPLYILLGVLGLGLCYKKVKGYLGSKDLRL